MKPYRQRRVNEHKDIRVGSVVISKPFWQDERYVRSVILVLEHDYSGSAGLILNKASTLSIHEALPDLNILYPLFFGGPSEIKTVSYIHNNPNVPESILIRNDVYWGGDYEEVVRMVDSKNIDVRLIKFCAGFVQWTPGQLESEVLDGKWWVDEINPQELFSTPADDLWAYMLISRGYMYGLLSNLPDPVPN